MFEYNKICKELLESLPERTKMIVTRRFGLFDNEKETLEFIGKEHGVTRERVRQVERDGLKQIKKRVGGYKDVFSFFEEELRRFGGVKKEESFVNNFLQNGDCKNCVVFLLNVSDGIMRFSESDETYALWTKDKETLSIAEETIDEVFTELKKERKLKNLSELKTKKDLTEIVFMSYLEISKRVICNEDGLYGLYSWPEINPKGIKDRAYLVLKKAGKPLHFRDVARMLGERANPQTTHNELIKDSRFVLVGRGVYALSEWGYVPGEVKEVIREILIKEGALHKNDIIIRVEEQRIVKKNTIIQNLSNKKYFIRTPDGKYTVA